jgi:hypothetical protein
MAPPVLESAVASPAYKKTPPPAPVFPVPTPTLIKPPFPFSADPVPTYKAPEFPELVVPELNTNIPLAPLAPLFMVMIFKLPLLVVLPSPLSMVNAPPVAASLLPA